MSHVVYTWKPEPFMIGGTGRWIRTRIEEYSRKSLGLGYYGLLFQNPEHGQWHVALEGCGALIGHGPTEEEALMRVRDDVADGDRQVMKEQIAKGKKDRDGATEIKNEEFFRLLKPNA